MKKTHQLRIVSWKPSLQSKDGSFTFTKVSQKRYFSFMAVDPAKPEDKPVVVYLLRDLVVLIAAHPINLVDERIYVEYEETGSESISPYFELVTPSTHLKEMVTVHAGLVVNGEQEEQ